MRKPSIKKQFLWIMSVCLSGQCNRNCSHCFFDANMNGRFFNAKNADLLAREIRKKQRIILSEQGKDLCFHLDFSGNGEPLLNPELVEVFDILFGQNQKITGAIVTSGVDSKSPEEAERLRKIISRDYASRLTFHLSFNLFEKRFPRRLIQTLKLLFENGVSKAGIKICQTGRRTMLTAFKLDNLIYHYFIRWIREVRPLASWEDFYECNLGREMEKMIGKFNYLNAGCKPGERRPLSKKEMTRDTVWLQSEHCKTIRFLTKFGEREIIIEPGSLMKQGRAVNLDDPGFSPNIHLKLCSFLNGSEKYFPHMGADGFFYPSCMCSGKKSLRLGHVSENFNVVYGRFLHLHKYLPGAILKNQNFYENICQLCEEISTQLYYEWKNKPLISVY